MRDDREAFEAAYAEACDKRYTIFQDFKAGWQAALASERAKPTKRMTPTVAQIELAKDAVAFLDLNGMHLAAGVVRRHVLKE